MVCVKCRGGAAVPLAAGTPLRTRSSFALRPVDACVFNRHKFISAPGRLAVFTLPAACQQRRCQASASHPRHSGSDGAAKSHSDSGSYAAQQPAAASHVALGPARELLRRAAVVTLSALILATSALSAGAPPATAGALPHAHASLQHATFRERYTGSMSGTVPATAAPTIAPQWAAAAAPAGEVASELEDSLLGAFRRAESGLDSAAGALLSGLQGSADAAELAALKEEAATLINEVRIAVYSGRKSNWTVGRKPCFYDRSWRSTQKGTWGNAASLRHAGWRRISHVDYQTPATVSRRVHLAPVTASCAQ